MNRPVNPPRGKTTDRRAVCGRTACTVRREGRPGQPVFPTPISRGVRTAGNWIPAYAGMTKASLAEWWQANTNPKSLARRRTIAWLRMIFRVVRWEGEAAAELFRIGLRVGIRSQ